MKTSDLARLEAQQAALQAKIEELRSDPDFVREKELREQLDDTVTAMGLSPQEAAALLNPERFSKHATKPQILLPFGRPRRQDLKLLLLDALREARIQINAAIARLESDEACAQKIRLEQAAKDAGFSPYEAAELLDPVAEPTHPIEALKDNHQPEPSHGGRGVRPMREWRNPHTGEVVQGRSPTLRKLREWAKAHDEDIEVVRQEWRVDADTPSRSS